MGVFQVTGELKTRHSTPGATHKSQIEGKDDGPQPAAYIFANAAQDVVLHPSLLQGHIADSCSTCCPSGIPDCCRNGAAHTIQSTPSLRCFVGVCWPRFRT